MARQALELPPEIAAQFSSLCPDHEDIDDFLRHQECVYQSLQSNSSGNMRNASTSDSINEGRRNEAHTSRSSSMDSDLEEAMALSLQLSGADYEAVSTSASSRTAADSSGRGGHSSSESSVVATQDDVNPDIMTYEQLQTLTDTIGSESKGLSEYRIARLPSKKYKSKSGWFSSKKAICSECVICIAEFEHGERLITLPCKHQYHTECIKRWLVDNKTCPVCKIELS